MNIKKIVATVSLGLASFAAAATPLAGVTGDLEIKLGGLTTETKLTSGTNESTWGIGYLETITSFDNASKWIAGTDDGYLYYMIYGVSDLSVIRNPSMGFDIYNVGATGGVADGKIHLDIYYSPTKIAAIDQQKNANPNGRTGFDSYASYAALGPAYLKLTFGEGIQTSDRSETAVDERNSTLVQHTQGAVSRIGQCQCRTGPNQQGLHAPRHVDVVVHETLVKQRHDHPGHQITGHGKRHDGHQIEAYQDLEHGLSIPTRSG